MMADLSDARALAAEFWRRMNSNDWASAAELFSDDFELAWPQSGEFIRSREAFVAVNTEYPASGRWSFSMHRLIGEGSRAVTETLVSDGTIRATAITFFDIEAGRIHAMCEFWPDPYPAPEWRRKWVST